jgi:hypothetical protein
MGNLDLTLTNPGRVDCYLTRSYAYLTRSYAGRRR